MLRELEGPPGEAANRALGAARAPRRVDSLVPAALAVGGALFIALAAWQAWQLAASYDARFASEATSRQ
ncbi:hypothetical protein D3C83_173460 [compost metagenome]